MSIEGQLIKTFSAEIDVKGTKKSRNGLQKQGGGNHEFICFDLVISTLRTLSKEGMPIDSTTS
jgi:hypothetical protein